MNKLSMQVPTEEWEVVPPTGGALFMAQHRGVFQRFRPTLTVQMTELLPGTSLHDLADKLAEDIRGLDSRAQVRKDEGGIHNGRLLQAVRFEFHPEGEAPLRLSQWQVLVEAPAENAEIMFAMTILLAAQTADIDTYKDDFQAFLRSATVTEDSPA